MKLFVVAVLAVLAAASFSEAWAPPYQNRLAHFNVGPSFCWTRTTSSCRRTRGSLLLRNNLNPDDDDEGEEWSDFDDLGFSGTSSNSASRKFVPGDDDKIDANAVVAPLPDFAKLLQERSGTIDWTAIQTRQFSLGQDFILSDYVGNMGFDEVTDWEYYYPSDDEDEDERKVVQPNPFDASKYVVCMP